MKRSTQLTISALLTLLPNLVLATQDYYVLPQIGISMQTNKVKFELLDRVIYEPEITKERFKNTANYGAIFGKKLYDNIFIELEVAAASNHKFNNTATINLGEGFLPLSGTYKTKLETQSVFINASYQFRDYIPEIVPYVLAGVGYSQNKIKATKLSSTERVIIRGQKTSNFAWQVGTGILVPVTDNIDINLSYKFRSLGKIKTGKKYDVIAVGPVESPVSLIRGNLYTSNILVGISFKF
ncbi:Outer membrane protein PagN precursor [Rickettsiales bacterium Ac37b]|nr:Outer membrane protein PagN precursor [Rickettsiales bacterium Ac37b]